MTDGEWSMYSGRVRWISCDILSRLQRTTQIILHKRFLNLFVMLKKCWDWGLLSDENGQIADVIWYLSLIPYHKCPYYRRSPCLYAALHSWCDQDDPGRKRTHLVSNMWCWTLSFLDQHWPLASLTSSQKIPYITLKNHEILFSASIGKGLFKYNHTHLYFFCCYFCTLRTQLRNCNRDL